MNPFEQLTRKNIQHHITTKYRTAKGTRPDLALVEFAGRKAVVKDFKGSDPLFRLIVGPILIARERAALSRLAGVEGIPQLLKRIDRYAILIEHVEGISLDAAEAKDLPEGFFNSLKPVIDKMHERGVAHCDLRSRGNLMAGSDGRSYVVDFAACVLRGRGLNPFMNWLFRQFVMADDHAVLMAKKRLTPEALTEDEKRILDTPLPYEEKAKKVGQWFRRTTRKLLTRTPQ